MTDAPCLICGENHNNLPCPKSIVRDPMPDATYQPKPALFELIDGLLPDLIPRAEAEAMVQTERHRTQAMHRRAQIAEGKVQRIDHMLALWNRLGYPKTIRTKDYDLAGFFGRWFGAQLSEIIRHRKDKT